MSYSLRPSGARLRLAERLARFAVVGVACYLVQLGLLHVLDNFMYLYCGDVIAFQLSAQLNFALSQIFTWGDRQHTERLLMRWVKFNANALLSVSIVNGAIFWTLVHVVGMWFWVAMLIANLASTVWTFTINHFVVFKGERQQLPIVSEETAMQLRSVDQAAPPSVALFMPAFNEASNLPAVVRKAYEFFDGAGIIERVVIVVDDGSTDETPAVIEGIQRRYPVDVVTHPTNHGYGRALRSGFEAALATGYEWIAFCDSDGQFNPADLALLLVAAQSHEVTVVLGVRAKRADNLARRAAGRGWHGISRLVLRYDASDVDCGFKLLHRSAIGSIASQLQSDYAAISPELLARLYRAGHQFIEIPVRHYPRTSGKQTGLRPTVVMRSFVDLFSVRHELATPRVHVSPGHQHRPVAAQEPA
jgi:putative flippase GtrA